MEGATVQYTELNLSNLASDLEMIDQNALDSSIK